MKPRRDLHRQTPQESAISCKQSRGHHALQRLLHDILGSELVGAGWRLRLLRLVGVTVGEQTYVGPRCGFDLSASITIGENVHIAPDVTIHTSTHDLGPSSRRGGPRVVAPVTIGPGVWIGAGAILLL